MKTLNPAVKAAFNRVMTRSELEEWCEEYTKAQGDKWPKDGYVLCDLTFLEDSFPWSSSKKGYGWVKIWNRFTKEELLLPLYIENP